MEQRKLSDQATTLVDFAKVKKVKNKVKLNKNLCGAHMIISCGLNRCSSRVHNPGRPAENTKHLLFFCMQMQIKLSDVMTDVAAKNESMTSQVEDLNRKLESLENQVLRLPQVLGETVKLELLKLKKEEIPKRKKRSGSQNQMGQGEVRLSTTGSESCRNSTENPGSGNSFSKIDLPSYSSVRQTSPTSHNDRSVT